TSTAPAHFRYAGFWIRTGAIIIDGLITSLVLGTVFFVFYGAAFVEIFRQAAEAGRQGNQVDPAALAPMFASIGVFQLFAFVASAAYSVFFVVKYGATPGKMAVGIKIVRPDGGPVPVGQAIGRYFAHMLSAIILYIG